MELKAQLPKSVYVYPVTHCRHLPKAKLVPLAIKQFDEPISEHLPS